MNRRKLKQYGAIEREIKELEARLIDLENLENTIQHDSVNASNSDFPYQPIKVHIEGIPRNSYKIAEMKEKIKERKEESDKVLLEITEFINSIENCTVRYICDLRYIKLKSWLEISMKLGANYPEYARKIHERYFKKR